MGEVVSGETVGEVSLLSDVPRSASIRAIRDSLLICLDREAFGRIAGNHPALVMRLAANVANLLQRRTGGRTQTSRGLKTICFLALCESESLNSFFSALSKRLGEGKKVLDLRVDKLCALGAPVSEAEVSGLTRADVLPDALRHWLADQEDLYDFVIYRCPAGENAWTHFALRQSDIALMVSDARSGPDQIVWAPPAVEGDFSNGADRVLILLQDDRTSVSGTAKWIDRLHPDYHFHVQKGLDSDAARVARVLSGTATGLVLGGGAARGLAALGAYQALNEAGISIDWVGGTSIGSIVGAAIAVGWSPVQATDLARTAFKDGRPFSDFTIPVYSLLRGRRMKRLLKTYLDYQIEDTALPYYCVSTNLGRGLKNIHTRGSLVNAICASAALPGVIPPAVIDSELTVDGALLDNLPVDVMQEQPVGRIIAVDVSSRVHYTVPFEEMPSPWAVLRGRWLPFTRKYRVPRPTTLLLKATEIGTLEHTRRHGEMADLLIDPQVRQFGMMDVRSFDRIVQAGYERTLELLDQERQTGVAQ
jgi:predicted acylesterase/phospholipase RssA